MQPKRKTRLDPKPILARAKAVLALEAASVSALVDRLDERFVRAVELILGCTGKIVVTGMGKSGHVCRKIAATLASTGSPALFLHPGEGAHGDLGVVGAGDLVLAISQSGETEELVRILPSLKRLGVPVIAMTGKPQSTLAIAAEVALDTSVKEEACPMGLAPTASTTATLALGDALAVSVLEARGFRPDEFAANHPGGSLGRRLLLRVEDVMHGGPGVPLVSTTTTIADAIHEVSSKRLGVTGVLDAKGNLVGAFTDGDLRRAIQAAAEKKQGAEWIFEPVSTRMSKSPKRIEKNRLAVDALNKMEEHKITSLFVFESSEATKPIGIVHLHDLVKAGLS